MNAEKVIEIMGGRKRVMQITGLSKGRISQWVGEDRIPHAWMMAFRAMKPKAFPVEKPARRTSGRPPREAAPATTPEHSTPTHPATQEMAQA